MREYLELILTVEDWEEYNKIERMHTILRTKGRYECLRMMKDYLEIELYLLLSKEKLHRNKKFLKKGIELVFAKNPNFFNTYISTTRYRI